MSGPTGEGQAESVLRRKLTAARADRAEGGPGADRGWRIALARAARDTLKLSLEVVTLVLERRSLAELLELPPERALIAVLEGPGEGLGVAILSPEVLSGFIENLTLGKISPGTPLPRKPTRTDAAMVAATVDAALVGLERALMEEADLIWAGGFRYASFLDDPRPLGLLLEDVPFRLLRAEVSLGFGARTGTVMLALPAEGRGRVPHRVAAQKHSADHGPAFAEALAERIAGADCALIAVLARLTMPLASVMSLQEGQMLAIPTAALDRISLEGVDGRSVATGKLGQNRGMRALRLTEAALVIGSRARFARSSAPVLGGEEEPEFGTGADGFDATPPELDAAPMDFGEENRFLRPTGVG